MSRRSGQNRLVGAIFPILPEHVSDLFSHHRDIFVKFTKLKLDRRSIIVFYVPHQKLLIGEARVQHMEKLNPTIAWSRYKDRLFLNQEEYDRYVTISPVSQEKRKMSDITVFELDNMTKYTGLVRSIYPITSSGRYLTTDMIKEIRKLGLPKAS